MGWVTAKVNTEADYRGTDQKSSAYGTRSPIISSQFGDAYKAFTGSLNPSGANTTQQGAMDTLRGLQTAGRPRAALLDANENLQGVKKQFNAMASKGPNLLGSDPRATAAMSANAPAVTAKAGASYMDAYRDPYEREVVDAALADYDAGAADQRTQLRGANASAFGNKRYGVSEGQFAGEVTRGRGSLSANLLSEGYKMRAGLGQADADRFLTADATNAANILDNNQFNAASQTDVSKFNTGVENDRDQFDINSMYQNDQQVMAALTSSAGLTQQQAENIVTADGVDTELAQSLFAAGSITQSQLESILSAAAQFNGSSYTENKNANTDTYGIKVGGEFGVG